MSEQPGDPVKDRREKHKSMSAESFARHVAARVAPGYWYCGRPGSGTYAFRILFLPGTIVVTGDIGCLVLNPHDRDSAGWARKADSLDYVLGKVHAEFERREFVRALAIEALQELAKDRTESHPADDRYVRECQYGISQIKDGSISDERGFVEFLVSEDLHDGCEPPESTDWSSNLLWCFHALRWLVEKHGPELETAP